MIVRLDHLPAQDEFYWAQDRQVAYVGGLATGKTHVASDCVLRDLVMFPRVPLHAFSNTYDQLTSGTLRTFYERCDAWGVEYVDRVRDQHKIFFPRLGAVLECRSVDKPIQWKSLEMSRVWIDEAQAWTKSAYDMVIGRLRGSATQRAIYPGMQRQVRITANPPHTMDHWLVDLTTKPDPLTGKPPIRLITASTYDNPFIPLDYIEAMEAQYDPEIAQAELHGKFIELGKGRVWRRFSRAKHLITSAEAVRRGLPPIAYDPTIPVCWGHDFNIDPMSSVIFQWRRVNAPGYQRDVMYVLDIIRARTSIIDDVVTEFMENKTEAVRIAKRRGLILYGDASGNAGNRQTGVSDWDALRAGLASRGLHGKVCLPTNPDGGPSVNPPLRLRAAAGNRMLENARGEIGVVLNADTCEYVATDFERQYYKPGTLIIEVPRVKDGEPVRLIGHLCDAATYPISYEYPMAELHAQPDISTNR